MEANFAIRELPDDVVRDDLEPLGTKPKFWHRDGEGEKWLFKYGRPGTGEHWAERIGADVARVLGLPHAEVELARHAGQWGTVSRDFTDGGTLALVHGNELLGELSADYPTSRRYRVKEHTGQAIWSVLGDPIIQVPSGVPIELADPKAFSLFAGYLLLDALIGNTDRHHENWGILLSATRPRRRELAPTFDHASSLGRELDDATRESRLASRDSLRGLAGYAERAKARSAIYRASGDKHAMSPLDAFLECRSWAPDVVDRGRERLDSIADQLSDWARRMPSEVMSEASIRFAAKLVDHNVGRLLRCR